MRVSGEWIRDHWRMIVDINLRRVKTMDEMRALTVGGGSLECHALDRESVRELLEWVLGKFRYRRLARSDKRVVRRFLLQFSGLWEAQLDRRIAQYLETGRVRDLRAGNSGRPFERVYTRADIEAAGGGGHQLRADVRERMVLRSVRRAPPTGRGHLAWAALRSAPFRPFRSGATAQCSRRNRPPFLI